MTDPVIVVSTPRSGSSWTSRILRGHPQLHVFTHNTLGTQFLYALYPLKMSNPLGDDYLGDQGVLDRLLKKVRTGVLTRYYRSPSEEKTLVLASPTYAEFLPLLREAFPTARYVRLRRNPFDVIASFRAFLRMNGTTGIAYRFNDRRARGVTVVTRAVLAHLFHSFRWLRLPEPGYIGTRPRGFQRAVGKPLLEFLAWYYARMESQIQRYLEPIPAERRFEVEYESLVNHGRETMTELFKFINVDVIEEHISKNVAAIRSVGLGRSKSAFQAHEFEELTRYLSQYGLEIRPEWTFKQIARLGKSG